MWVEGSELYLNDRAGTITSARLGIVACRQSLAIVTRTHATVGSLYVYGTRRCTDVPDDFTITGNITADWGYFNSLNITDDGYIDGNIFFLGDLYLADYFSDACGEGNAIQGIDEWGSFTCIGVGAEGNLSWNQSFANTLYAGIEWDYNQTIATFNLYNSTWDNRGLINNSWTQALADTLY